MSLPGVRGGAALRAAEGLFLTKTIFFFFSANSKPLQSLRRFRASSLYTREPFLVCANIAGDLLPQGAAVQQSGNSILARLFGKPFHFGCAHPKLRDCRFSRPPPTGVFHTPKEGFGDRKRKRKETRHMPGFFLRFFQGSTIPCVLHAFREITF